MLIVSKFHDYYDTASIYGIDKTCVYQRKEYEVPIKRVNWEDNYFINLPNGRHFPIARNYSRIGKSYFGDTVGEVYVHQRVVGFCGQFYPAVIIEPHPEGKSHYFYNANDFSAFVVKENIFRNKSRFRFSPRWDAHNLEYREGVSNFFDTSSLGKYGELFHAFKVPVFVIGDHKNLTLNPCLKDLGFMKIKDPQTAFQDIYMFLSGVIGAPTKETKPIDDKTMAASKGHDGKYSFRKPPGKRGKTRWR